MLDRWCVYTRVLVGLVDNRKGAGKVKGRKRMLSRWVEGASFCSRPQLFFVPEIDCVPKHHLTVPEACSRCLIQMNKCQVKEDVVRKAIAPLFLTLQRTGLYRLNVGLF